MNFLSHTIPYFDQPLLAVSCGVPDWLSVVDRRLRVRGKSARQFVDSDDGELSAVAQAVIQHIEDDRWFHGTRAFVETNMQLAIELRFLYDYLDDNVLLMRFNQVMNRVGLPQLPAAVGGWLPRASNMVESRRRELLTPSEVSSRVANPFEKFFPKKP